MKLEWTTTDVAAVGSLARSGSVFMGGLGGLLANLRRFCGPGERGVILSSSTWNLPLGASKPYLGHLMN